MPRYSYTDFTVDSEDMNVPGSSDVTKPSEGWKGRDANDALRATNSAIRNLGDVAAKLPANPDGSPNNGPNQGRIGTAAFQDAGSAQITGGILGPNVRGSMGRGCLIMIVCSPAEVNAVYAEQRTRGFDLCDGRTTINPYSPFNTITMPNFMGRFPWFADAIGTVNSFQFGANNSTDQNTINISAQRVITVSDHTHGTPVSPGGQGQVGGTTLSYNQIPAVVTNVQTIADAGGAIAQANQRGISLTFNNNEGFGGSHTHLVGFAGGFTTGNIDIRPPAIAVLPFLRVW